MYEHFFGMNERPFSLSPDTHYFFCHSGHQEALNVLIVALNSGEGFVKIVGEVGTGKTLLCRELLNRLGEEYYTAYIPNPYLSPISLRMVLAEELGVNARGLPSHELVNRIYARLIEIHKHGQRVVICLDEVQAMPDETLEALRLLTNLETEKRKLLQIVLFGQPELNEKLARPNNRQLLQRIVYSYSLSPLDRNRVASYLSHRLSIAGYNGEALFNSEAIDDLYRASRGIPRLINILGNKSMMLAYGKGERKIGHSHVKAAVQDTESLKPLHSFIRDYFFNIGLGLGTLLLLSGLYMLWVHGL